MKCAATAADNWAKMHPKLPPAGNNHLQPCI